MTDPAGRDRDRRRSAGGFVRPVRPLVPITSSFFVLLGWGVVAHNSGAGWVQALGDVLAGTLLLGIAGPGVILARVRLEVTAVPSDATVGLPVDLRVVSSSRVRLTPIDPSGPATFVGPARGSSAGSDVVTLVPVRRGVVAGLTVNLASAAPFGLLWWTRRAHLDLPSELHIGPKLGQSVALPRQDDDHAGDSAQRSSRDIGEPRGVRPYRPGDSRRGVHWPATAHSGELMVREMEGPTAEPVVVVVTLPAEVDKAESVAERAFGTLVALFDRGMAVVLTTTEQSGRRTGAVADRRSAGRRLARAVGSGHPGDRDGNIGPPPSGSGPRPSPEGDAATTGVTVTMGQRRRGDQP
ncbi:MAG TPA: DUF58 domain-containing protein [Acidimicrobiales bacterium]|nr:DUF58 domain-containing protein [Acidimicrobiales bacterium]